MTTIRVPAGQDITPAWNVQAFVDAVSNATGADSFGTYIGHEPTAELAVDCFVQVWTTELGNKICDFALPHIDTYGIDYVIFRQKIYNPEIATYWRQMEDRGSPTANHYDHVHLSFVEMARKPIPDPMPIPTPDPVPVPMEVDNLYIFDGPQGIGGIWYTDGYYKWGVPNEDELIFWREGGVKHLGTISKAAFYGLRLRNDGIVDNPGVG